MRRFRYLCLCVAALCVATYGLKAASSNVGADAQLKAAWDAFTGTFYQRADNLCTEFVQKYPASAHLPEIILLQARSRLELSNYAGAIQLLSANQEGLGVPKDQFVFWMAETRLREGKVSEANDLFARVVAEFPSSPLRAQAAVMQARAAEKQNDWNKVVTLLAAANGPFQQEALTNAADPAVLQGYFLLAEGYLKTSNYTAANAVLEPIGKRPLNPTNAWAWNYLQCRVHWASGNTSLALASVTNMAVLATDVGIPMLLAETFEVRGEILEQLRRWDEAMAAYTNNLSATTPVDQQRTAVTRITKLSVTRTNVEEGAQILERFAGQSPVPACADLAWVKGGELRLRDYLRQSGPGQSPNNALTSNRLELAIAAFQAALKQSPSTEIAGNANYHLGWCYWFQDKFAESGGAFNRAAEQLQPGLQRARARLKLADAEFRLREFDAALTNYNGALSEIPRSGVAETNLIEPALYQTVRSALAAGDRMAASNALGRIITQYPGSFYAGSATLLFGQTLGRSGTPAKAREVFTDFLNKSPDTALKPELELAIARTYEQETNWAKAVGTYDGWLREYTNHSARAEAMFYYGQALFHVGDETNAYTSFTNFLAAYPKHPLAAQAQWSVADRYYQTEAYQKAENDFQLIALNWPGTDLSYEALMMAGRAAFSRQGWNDATNYFERVIKATNCSPELHFSAIFAYADTVMSQVSTNKESDYVEASRYFDTICQQYPTNHLAVLACGEKAVCLLQLARSGVGLTNAAEAFSAVLTNNVYADGHAVTVAKVGLGVVLEKQAAAVAGAEQGALRYAALDQYLDVLDGRYLKGSDGDEFWTREAAMCGVRLATDMQEWQKVVNFCDRIIEKVPSSASLFEEPRRKAVENLARGKIAADRFDRQKTSD